MDPRIKLAVEIMESELDQPLLVSKVSVRLGLSASRFEHLFKRETGKAFKTRLRESRLEKARDLLIDHTLSIKEVAFAVGYSFTPNFTRDFRKRFGKPPSQTRNRSA